MMSPYSVLNGLPQVTSLHNTGVRYPVNRTMYYGKISPFLQCHYFMMIHASNGHAFHAYMKKHDVLALSSYDVVIHYSTIFLFAQ